MGPPQINGEYLEKKKKKKLKKKRRKLLLKAVFVWNLHVASLWGSSFKT